MSCDQHAADFALQAANKLGVANPSMIDYGATKSARFELDGRRVEILAGRTFEIEIGLALGGFPSDASITYAPAGLYTRVKLLEDGPEPVRAIAGVDAFDKTYLVLGPGARLVVAGLAKEGLDALSEAEDLCRASDP